MDAVTARGPILAGRYRLGPRLGHGAMADVCDGVDIRLERAVAIQVLRTDRALGPDLQVRFAGEARAAAGLRAAGGLQQGQYQQAMAALAAVAGHGPSLRRGRDGNG